MRKINLFVVTDDRQPANPMDIRLYTITNTRAQSEEFINKLLMIENSAHYLPWCELRKIKPDDMNSWFLYVKQCEVNTHKYHIEKVQYLLKDVAAIFRMFNHCIPIGCSYDDKFEVVTLLNSIPPEKVEELKQKIESLNK